MCNSAAFDRVSSLRVYNFFNMVTSVLDWLKTVACCSQIQTSCSKRSFACDSIDKNSKFKLLISLVFDIIKPKTQHKNFSGLKSTIMYMWSSGSGAKWLTDRLIAVCNITEFYLCFAGHSKNILLCKQFMDRAYHNPGIEEQ